MIFKSAKELIEDARGHATYYQKRATLMHKHQVGIRLTLEFIAAVTKRFDESSISANTWVTCDTWDGCEDPVGIEQSYRARVDSMKEGLVPQMLKVLMEAGFEVTKTNDNANEGSRCFNLVRPKDQAGRLNAVINFYAVVSGSEHATCRKVQIGTEVKEIPVYALECPEATPEEIQGA